MEGLSITSIWKFLTWLPRCILKLIFTKSKLADLILIDVRPRYDYATLNLGEVASVDVWLQLINLSPFEVELDRANFKFLCGGVTIKSYFLKKEKIGPGQIKELYVSENITNGQANQIAKTLNNHQSSIEMDAEFNCILHSFAKSTGNLSGLRPRFINQERRIES